MNLPYDICRCATKTCPVKDSCQRYVDKGEGAYRISWCDFSESLEEDSTCTWLIPVDDR